MSQLSSQIFLVVEWLVPLKNRGRSFPRMIYVPQEYFNIQNLEFIASDSYTYHHFFKKTPPTLPTFKSIIFHTTIFLKIHYSKVAQAKYLKLPPNIVKGIMFI